MRPKGSEAWETWPALSDIFPWQQPGTKVGRAWPIAPLKETLEARWQHLAAAKTPAEKARCFFNARFGRRTDTHVAQDALPRPASFAPIEELKPSDPTPAIVPYGYRSFDRQWIIADARLMRTPSRPLWYAHSEKQTYIATSLTDVLGEGPALVASEYIPDLHFFRGRGGKDIIPLYRDPNATQPNLTEGLAARLGDVLDMEITPEDVFAYAYALLSSPSYVNRFWDDLDQPGLRLPITKDPHLFAEAVAAGRVALSIHTQGRRFSTAGAAHSGNAKLTKRIGNTVPDGFEYDQENERLLLGDGVLGPVSPAVWAFEISGWRVLFRWLNQRLRQPSGRAGTSESPLDQIRPSIWPQQYTVELLELIWTLERAVDHDHLQAKLLADICGGPTFEASELPVPEAAQRKPPKPPPLRRQKVSDGQLAADV
jgi:hypothetical protein